MAGISGVLMDQRNKIILTVSGIVLVALFWIMRISTAPDQQESLMISFLSLEDIDEAGDRRVRLGGIVEPGSIMIQEANLLDCNFTLAQGSYKVPVHYTHARPDLFKDEAEVIVTGQYVNGVFEADELQTKCASRYEGDLRNDSSYQLDDLDI
ncbi:MAG: cytochrome c maturation protein CcmE [Candidatus Marinimicrobia bacterium]|nr:cytochrome c maturation protein CcmE [Candidatus Neomarinimicrobiota bacterium]